MKQFISNVKPVIFGLILLGLILHVFVNATISEANNGVQGTSRTTFGHIIWEKLPNGRALANIKGDFRTGPHTKFIKFPAGQKTAPHYHSYSYVGIVVKGRARHFEPGKPKTETILPAGSTWNIPGDVVHISECLAGEDCIFVTEQEGLLDEKLAK